MRNVLICYDTAVAKCSPEQFSAYLSVHKNIKSWSAPFSGVAVIKLESNVQSLFDDIKKIIGTKNIIITVLSVGSTGGRMPSGFWEWFNADDVTPSLIEAIKEGQKG